MTVTLGKQALAGIKGFRLLERWNVMFINSNYMESSDGLHPSRNRPDNSIITLAMGILTQAVRDLIRPQTRRERDWKEWKEDAKTWVHSDETEFGSFHWVCSVIKANPPDVRNWIESLKGFSEAEKKSTIQMLLRLTYNGTGQNKNNSCNNPEPDSAKDDLKRTA
jgi:hypothetical protein